MERISKISTTLILATLVACFVLVRPAAADPLLANYYLSDLPTDANSVNLLAKYKVLIIQPWEAVYHRSIVDQIKQKNPSIIILAYVPAKSYDANWKNYPANLVYKDFVIQDNWWLKDPAGNITSDWPGHSNLTVSQEYSDYLVNYLKNNVLSQKVFDGIFWDVVYDSLSWQNGGNLDINGDGQRDNPAAIDAEWLKRIQYLMQTSRDRLGVRYLVFNGTSVPALQRFVNGRMYENFPTPWEANGSWAGLMNTLQQNKISNLSPELYIFNSNTNNTGNQADYKTMRFGLGSSLLTDNVYFSFDYGNKDHGQIWWYDEYDAKLGAPAGAAASANGSVNFTGDIWRRDFEHGLVLVNASPDSKTVDLGGDYERIIGTQDTVVNDGGVDNTAIISSKDAIILYKTAKTLTGGVFINGSFARFYNQNGNRARNGLFVYEDAFSGGAKIFNGDLDGDGRMEKVVVSGPKLEIFASNGGRLYNDYPFGGNLRTSLNVAVGRLGSGKVLSVVLAPQAGSGQLMILNYNGSLVKKDVYPLGKKYTAGFSVAIAKYGNANQIILGVGKSQPAEVLVLDLNQKIVRRFYPYDKKFKGGINVAAADFNGDGQSEIATVSLSESKPVIRLFDSTGKKLREFTVRGFFGRQDVALSAMDVNYEGKLEIVAMTKN